MALSDLENQECLCSWVNALGSGPKVQLRAFVAGARVIIEAAKVNWLLVNADYEDIAKKQGLELVLTLYRQATAPIEAPLVYLTSITAPYADCPPVATLSQTMNALKKFVLGPVKDLDREIQDYSDAIEINQATAETLDRLIGFLDDILDAIDIC